MEKSATTNKVCLFVKSNFLRIEKGKSPLRFFTKQRISSVEPNNQRAVVVGSQVIDNGVKSYDPTGKQTFKCLQSDNCF